MNKILDQFGKPIDRAVLKEPQTANVMGLKNQYLTPMLSGLTPARLARTLQAADDGNLIEQHRLFADMEERDGHLCAEMGKRKNAVVGLPWDIVPPRDASAQEKSDAAWVKETLQDAIDGMEDMLQAAMDAVGHGFAPIELEWRREDGQLLPAFHPRPQEWFRLNQERDAIHLSDNSVDGAPLRPFGWVMHIPGKAKTGYSGRMGLHRTLVWPFLYKAYALGDFAEFLETYGLPIITGKYGSGATADEKISLMRAVTALGHDARAIMPAEMELEVHKVTTGSGESGHMAMMAWADKTESKVLLGQTLSADTGDKGGGSFALGKVHNEVRHDIMRGDAIQVGATLTRDLVYPMIMLNRPGVTSLKRCPRFVIDVGQPEDIAAYAESLPKLVGIGMQVPLSWAQEKLHIPMPVKGEAVLAVQGAPAAAPAADAPGTSQAALSAQLATEEDAAAALAAELGGATALTWAALVDKMKGLVDAATSLEALQSSLLAEFGGEPQDELVRLMGAAFALAELKGMSDVQDAAS